MDDNFTGTSLISPGCRQTLFAEDIDETSRDLPHGLERRRPHPVEPHAAEGRQLGVACSSACTTELKGDAWLIGRVTGREFAKRGPIRRRLARRFRANTGSRGATRPPGDRSRSARQDRLGPLRHRRRSDRRGAVGAGLRTPISRVCAPSRCPTSSHGKHGDRSRAGAGDPEPGAQDQAPVAGGRRRLERRFPARRPRRQRSSLAILPAVDGAKGAPSVFDSSDKDAGVPARSDP